MNAIVATYEDISDCWPIFKHNIEGFFPLKNVCKPRIAGASEMNTLIHTIPIVSIRFIPLKAELLTEKNILNRHERPYLHIFIGFCEDIDVYRQKFRPKMKSWLETVSIKKNHQYVVILIENQFSTQDINKSGSAFLLDKIRFDFSDKVALKLISLKLMPGENLNSLPECIELISDCIYQSSLMNLANLDDDIKKLAEKRNLAGWNFCNFFLTKESKALSLYDLGLFSEAIACYDELEALLAELQNSHLDADDKSLFCFETKFPSNPNINGSDLNCSNWSRYRELIYQNKISLYEFSIYLFSRQLYVLLELKNYANIMKRCKEFVCRFSFNEEVDNTIRKRWVFEIVFSVLKITESGLSQIGPDAELSRFLVDILILADSQIVALESISQDNGTLSDQVLNLSQIIALSFELKAGNIIQFRIALLSYCLSILKPLSIDHRCLMIRLRLSDLNCERKWFNVALEILQDTVEKVYPLNWPKIQQIITKKICNCYWNLNMSREYLRNFFEIFHISDSQILLDDTERDKLEKSIELLDDTLLMNFSKFLKIRDLKIGSSTNDHVQVQIVFCSSIDLPFHKFEVDMTLSGENEDITSDISSLAKIGADTFSAVLSFKNDNIYGPHKLKSIRVKLGKLVFESDSASNLWNQDINFINNQGLTIKLVLPDNFDFINPSIILLCHNDLSVNISNLSLSIICSDLINSFKLNDYSTQLQIESPIDPNSSIDVKYSLGKYYTDRKSIKIDASFNCEGILKGSKYWFDLDLPRPWRSDHATVCYKSLNLECLRIFPDFKKGDETIKIFDIGFGEENLKNNDFEFEIDRDSELHLTIPGGDLTQNLKLSYHLSNNEKAQSAYINTVKSDVDSIYCKLTRRSNSYDTKITSLVTFDIHLEGHVDFCSVPYSIVYDHTKWLLSGPCNGLCKENWSFEMISISPGLVSYPSIVLSTSIPVHFLNDGASTLVIV